MTDGEVTAEGASWAWAEHPPQEVPPPHGFATRPSERDRAGKWKNISPPLWLLRKQGFLQEKMIPHWSHDVVCVHDWVSEKEGGQPLSAQGIHPSFP